jgi:hypothetical protein
MGGFQGLSVASAQPGDNERERTVHHALYLAVGYATVKLNGIPMAFVHVVTRGHGIELLTQRLRIYGITL